MNPKPEDLGEPALIIAGLQLWVHGYQFVNSNDYHDANWLRVTTHAGAAGASVWATGAILMVPDLLGLGNECEALAQGRAQAAKLAPLEPELLITISRRDRLGHFTMQVAITPDHMTQEHSFQFEVDQSELLAVARQCRAIVAKFPVRCAEANPGV